MAVIASFLGVLLILALLAGIGYALYITHQALTMPERVLARQARIMAKEAAAAARRGDYMERDRLDHARDQVLASINPRARTKAFEGSDFDDFSQRYLND